MRLHEYQAKAVLARHGVRTPQGAVVHKGASIADATAALEGPEWVLKAQIHAGARGKAGGVVRVARDEAASMAGRWLGGRLVTAQTGRRGQPVDAVLVEEPVAAVRELYLACVLDRRLGQWTLLAGAEGGVDIEEAASVIAHPIAPLTGLMPYEGRGLARKLGLRGALITRFAEVAERVVALARACDALLVEINPLMVTADDELVAGDAKIEIDDNALFRQPDLAAARDPLQNDAKDEEARALGLQYIALDGDIGCLVNGAGLAMATMDLIALAGGRPANFLDVGGGTSAQKVAEALALVMSDERVKAVFVNIFGGIVRCDLIAEGLLMAAQRFTRGLPIVVRLVGTRAAEGQALLAASGLAVEAVADLKEAAERAVRRAGAP